MRGRARLARWIRRLRGDAPAAADRITRQDIVSCYRLLLDRAPDAEGMRTYEQMIGGIDVRDLVTFFVASPEFKKGRHYRTIAGAPNASRAVRVDLGTHAIYVLEDDPTIGNPIRATKQYEPHVAARLSRALEPGATFVDVGASAGFFTLLAAGRVGTAGRVVAFEPSPANCRLLAASLLANGFDNVTLHPAAVSDVEELLLYDAVGSNGFVSPLPREAEAAETMLLRTVVRAVVLDRVLGGVDRVDVVKIDVEGAEHRALTGATTMLRDKRPVVFSEFGPVGLQEVSGVAPEDYLHLLLGVGYELAVLHRDGTVERCGREPGAVLDAHARVGLDHVDLVAFDPARHRDVVA
jgi:FkbM family methyltransferase